MSIHDALGVSAVFKRKSAGGACAGLFNTKAEVLSNANKSRLSALVARLGSHSAQAFDLGAIVLGNGITKTQVTSETCPGWR